MKKLELTDVPFDYLEYNELAFSYDRYNYFGHYAKDEKEPCVFCFIYIGHNTSIEYEFTSLVATLDTAGDYDAYEASEKIEELIKRKEVAVGFGDHIVKALNNAIAMILTL